MKSKPFLLLILGIGFFAMSYAQPERKHIREGNELYESGKYADAEDSYRKAIDENSSSYEGSFNLGDASYRQEKYEDAANQFELLTHKDEGKEAVANSYHNMGNSLLQEKKYEKAVEAYKNSLRNNPRDMDTKYNLAYAQQKLMEQQQQDQNQDQENKDEEKEDEEKKEQEQKKDEQKDQEQKDQKNQEQQKDKSQENQEQQPQPQPDKISKEDAQRMLDALRNEEMDIQQKLKKKRASAQKVKIDKDW